MVDKGEKPLPSNSQRETEWGGARPVKYVAGPDLPGPFSKASVSRGGDGIGWRPRDVNPAVPPPGSRREKMEEPTAGAREVHKRALAVAAVTPHQE